MKILIAGIMAAVVALAGEATAGAGCASAQKAAEKPKTCGYKMGKAKDCGGCQGLHASAKQLRVAGADVEVVKTKRGYIVIATADSKADVETVRKASAARNKALVEFGRSDAPKGCENCSAFAKAVDAGTITFEEVEIDNGVMTVYTATTDEALSVLGKCCGMLKA